MKIYVSLSKKNKKLLKYAILFILGCILIYYSSILNVNATSSTTSTILSDITFPLAVEIRDNISGFPSLNFSTNYGYDENYTSAWINKEIVSMNSAGVVVSIPEVLECGHSYVLYNYWAVNGAYMIDYSASSSRVLGVGLGLGNIPNLSITESINSGRFPAFEYVTTVATGTNQYADFTHVSMSYIKFTNNTCNGAQRNLYFSQMSNISATFQSNKLAYLGYRLIDTTTLSSSEHAQLDRIEESINNLTLADVENKLNQIQEEQKNTSNAIDEQIQQDKEQHEAEMEQDKEQHEETIGVIEDNLNNCRESKNLFNLTNISSTNENMNFDYTDGLFRIWGNNGNLTYFNLYGGRKLTLPADTYTMSLSKPVNLPVCIRLQETSEWSSGSNYCITAGNTSYTFTLDTERTYQYVFVTFKNSNVDYNEEFYFMLNQGTEALDYEPYGQEICTNKIDETNDKLDDLNDSINSSDTSGANNEANNFFNDFESNDFGLSDIITLPLTTIQSITSKSCTPLSLTLPFVNKTFELPCMTTIYSKFEPFYSIYQTITFGVISYWVCVQIYAMVKGFKDPAKDEIEVMDL